MEISVIPAIQQQEEKTRVAAYCRVSSDSEDQLNSFAVQVGYYTDLIQNNPEWEFAGIYADEGLSGLSTAKREQFQRLMADCWAGKINMVLVKSISRFARNTTDCLDAVRELKACGVRIIFEKEGIDTASVSSEMIISMLGAAAQEESLSISRNLKWGIRKRMERGEYITNSVPFGYKLSDGKMVPDEGQAMIVRLIFKEYLSGHGLSDIAAMLNEYAPQEQPWHERRVAYILTNEKYVGDSLFQKTYTTDALPLKRHRNRDEVPKFYINNTHEAIIDRESFQNVQILLARRQSHTAQSDRSPFSLKIHCACCGAILRRHLEKKSSTTRWICNSHFEKSDACPLLPVTEEEIKNCCLRMHNKLVINCDIILCPMLENLKKARQELYFRNSRIRSGSKEMSLLLKKVYTLANLRDRGLITEEAFDEKNSELNFQIECLKEKQKKQPADARFSDSIEKTLSLIGLITEAGPLSRFDEVVFIKSVSSMKISNDSVWFTLNNDLKVMESRRK